MAARLWWLILVLLLAATVTFWRSTVSVPAPNLDDGGDDVGAAVNRSLDIQSVYTLAESEVIRFIPKPDPEERRRLLDESGIRLPPNSPPIVSVTAVLNGRTRIRGLVMGYEIVPRRLFRVLLDSLCVPAHCLEGLDVARGIGLSGDWVVRANADIDLCMAYTEEVVRQSGHPGFRIIRCIEKRKAHALRGEARAPEREIQFFKPHPDAPPVHAQTGTLLAFGEALSAAIARPILVQAAPQQLRVAWRDNSDAYLAFGATINEQMIDELLAEVADALGITVTDSEAEQVIWRLTMSR